MDDNNGVQGACWKICPGEWLCTYLSPGGGGGGGGGGGVSKLDQGGVTK